MNRVGHESCKSENTEKKIYKQNLKTSRILKLKISLLELKKGFKELRYKDYMDAFEGKIDEKKLFYKKQWVPIKNH